MTTPDDKQLNLMNDAMDGARMVLNLVKADLDAALADNARLRALVKRAEESDLGGCSWCGARYNPFTHNSDCPAFTPDGKVK